MARTGRNAPARTSLICLFDRSRASATGPSRRRGDATRGPSFGWDAETLPGRKTELAGWVRERRPSAMRVPR